MLENVRGILLRRQQSNDTEQSYTRRSAMRSFAQESKGGEMARTGMDEGEQVQVKWILRWMFGFGTNRLGRS